MAKKDSDKELEKNAETVEGLSAEPSSDILDAEIEYTENTMDITGKTEDSEESNDDVSVAEIEPAETDINKTEDLGFSAAPQNDMPEESFQELNPMVTVRPVKFQSFEMEEPNRSIKRNLDIMQDISMHISVELGKSKATIKEVMDLDAGSIVELDKIAGEQVEIYANNKLIARGEVIVIEDKFGVRVTSTNIPKVIQ